MPVPWLSLYRAGVSRFFLAMVPVAKGRPRFGRGRVYTPKPTKRAERLLVLLLGPHRPADPLEGPVEVEVEFVMPLPDGYPRRLLGAPHPRKPDLDNLLKLVMDGVQAAGGWWVDDSQVAFVRSLKRYQNKGEEPGIWLQVRGLMATLPE